LHRSTNALILALEARHMDFAIFAALVWGAFLSFDGDSVIWGN
jgi:hypothetical protein